MMRYFPFRTRFGVVAKQNMVKSRRSASAIKQGMRAVPASVAFALVTFYASGNQVCRSAFTALCARQDMIKREIFCVTMLSAILATITVTDVHASTLHGRFAAIAPDINIMAKPYNGGDTECGRGRTRTSSPSFSSITAPRTTDKPPCTPTVRVARKKVQHNTLP